MRMSFFGVGLAVMAGISGADVCRASALEELNGAAQVVVEAGQKDPFSGVYDNGKNGTQSRTVSAGNSASVSYGLKAAKLPPMTSFKYAPYSDPFMDRMNMWYRPATEAWNSGPVLNKVGGALIAVGLTIVLVFLAASLLIASPLLLLW